MTAYSTKYRKSLYTLTLTLIFVFITLATTYANQKIQFEKVDIGSNRSIGAGFVQDLDGFFWIGAQPGLIKWNGTDNTIYTQSNSGLSDNTITAIIEDSKGLLWIGTMGGLNSYNKETNSFIRFTHNPADPNSLSHESVGMINHFQSLLEDKNGDIWIATQNGLNSFSPELHEFKHFLHDPEVSSSLSNNIVNAIFEDSNGSLWVGTKSGLNRFNENKTAFKRYTHDGKNPASISNNEIYAIMEDNDGQIWIGTENGLNQYDSKTDSFIRFYHDPNSHRRIANNKVTSINKDNQGRLWLCHYGKGSVTLFNPYTQQSNIYRYAPNNPTGLPTNDVKYVYQDRHDALWFVSTTGGNLYKHDKNTHKFKTFKQEPNNPNSLNGSSVLPIYEDSRGIIWIGTDKNKLNKYDKNSGHFTNIPISGYYPYAFLEDSYGTFWVGETTGRLSIFDRSSETYIKSYDGISSSFINHIAQDSNNPSILWLTTHKDGLVKFNIKTEKIVHFQYQDRKENSLSNNSIWGFAQEEDVLWLGTWGGGLNKFNKAKETFTVYQHNPDDPKSISSNVSGNLLLTSANELFISTLGGGLNKFNRKTNTFERYSTKNGLFPSDNLEGLLEDEQGNLWIASSSEEVIKFDPNTLKYKGYGSGDGIEIGAPWFVSNHKTHDGQMWFGGPKGVTAFYPDKIKNNTFRPPVYITSLTQGGEPIASNTALERISEVHLSWKKPFFEFKATALNYLRSEHNRYRYKLEGWDKNWFESGVYQNGRYSNLKAGEYILRITGSNNDGIWSSPQDEVALNIFVSSPFWRTWWFYLALASGILLLLTIILLYFIKLKSEIQKRKQAKYELQYQAHYDALTNLPNRVLFSDRLSQAVIKSIRHQEKFALLFIDLDRFKPINDSLGHKTGDRVLQTIADRLKSLIRNEDTVARLSGDEFAIIMMNLSNEQDASLLAQKVLTYFAKAIIVNQQNLYVSCSIGISLYPKDDSDATNLLKYADAAMYKAKEEGRNNFQYYSSELTALALEHVMMETNLRQAIQQNEFIVYYQPQIDAKSNKLIGMEALIRWQHSTMGLISPSKFIPLAEETGLIVELDQWVMRMATKQIVAWYKQGFNPGVLALNLSMKQLQQDNFIAMLVSILEETQCKPEWLELEVTESQIMTNPNHAISILNQISEMGIELAIDDFGTGYSSLSYLKRLPIDKLKIDRSFVKELPDDENDAGISKAVIALSKSLNIKVIAEGVETEEQKEFLLENGCTNIQGYFYSKPVAAENMELFMRKHYIQGITDNIKI